MDQSTIEWRDVIDTADGRNEMIVGNWQMLAATAWQEYLKSGRGGILLDLKNAPNARTFVGVTVEGRYITLESLKAEAASLDDEGNPDIEYIREPLALLSDYEPTREIVVFIVSGDGDVLRTRCLHSESDELLDPPEAFRAEKNTHRNDPYLS